MPQYIIKLTTYEPAIIEALECLRKCRKQAAFTLEALKYFLLSENGAKVLQLMSHENSPSGTVPSVNVVDPYHKASSAHVASQEMCIKSPHDDCTGVIKKIME